MADEREMIRNQTIGRVMRSWVEKPSYIVVLSEPFRSDRTRRTIVMNAAGNITYLGSDFFDWVWEDV